MLTKKDSMFPEFPSPLYSNLFYITFWIIYLTNIFVINAKLNVTYFSISTTLLSVKLYLCFLSMKRRNPGYVEKSDSLEYRDILKNVP